MSGKRLMVPVSVELCRDFQLANVFARFANRPGCLWFDSASNSPRRQSRYSFLTSDPLKVITARIGDPDPWPALLCACNQLPTELAPDLPPFQGGIAGLIGYEAATWLESIGCPKEDDFPTPAISLGLYEWTLATDHKENRSWIIARDMDNTQSIQEQITHAHDRIDRVQRVLAGETVSFASCRSSFHNSSSSYDRSASPQVATPTGQFKTDLPGVTSNFHGEGFQRQVAEIVKRIRRGDSFQVNLAQRLLIQTPNPPSEIYQSLRATNPAPFAAYYNGGDFQVLSSSPEGFLTVREGHVETRPIKGTTKRVGHRDTDTRLGNQLEASEKDRAENIMIVDLMRNDLSRVCTDESVEVTQLCQLESYQYVQHLVSVVEGQLRSDEHVGTLLKACFPGGSVTGAPKIEAMKTIADLEPHRRGPYCGSLGYISTPSTADFNILIRTLTIAKGYCQIPVGGGITARSEPQSEEAETWSKAEGMLQALGKSAMAQDPDSH